MSFLEKHRNKEKKKLRSRVVILEKYQEEVIELLDKYFPKGSKLRGEAMCILAVAFHDGMKAQEELNK